MSMHPVAQSMVHVRCVLEEAHSRSFLNINKQREGLQKACKRAALALNSALEVIHQGVQQVSKQISMIFEVTGLCTLTIAYCTACMPGNVA